LGDVILPHGVDCVKV